MKNHSKNIFLQADNGERTRNKPGKHYHNKVMIILIFIHLGGYENFKQCYLFYVSQHLNMEFFHLVSYIRFVELRQQIAFTLVISLKLFRMGQRTVVSVSLI